MSREEFSKELMKKVETQSILEPLEREFTSYLLQKEPQTDPDEALKQARQMIRLIGPWPEDSLTKDAANIYLVIRALKDVEV